tara:strand:- start:1877 stop:1996 length:120 start_codon:yes stop_codon:yes gene_type:complete
MKKTSEAGKGSTRRNEDRKKIEQNWDNIKWTKPAEKKAK